MGCSHSLQKGVESSKSQYCCCVLKGHWSFIPGYAGIHLLITEIVWAWGRGILTVQDLLCLISLLLAGCWHV